MLKRLPDMQLNAAELKFDPTLIPKEIWNDAVKINPEAGFYYDMRDLLTGKRAGSFFHYVLTGPSISLWEDFTRAAEADGTYYQFTNESDLIKENPDWFRQAAGIKDGETSMAVELGTGSEHGVKNKTIPFVEAVNASVYVGVDESFASAFGAAQGVRESRPQTSAYFRQNDFNRDNLKLDWNDFKNEVIEKSMIDGKMISGITLPKILPHHRVIGMFGSTLENAQGFMKDGLPEDYVINCLKNYRRQMRDGDTMFIGLDQNQNRISIGAAYSDERIAQFSMALLQRIKDELPVSKSFDPNDFEYKNQWYPGSHLFVHGFMAKNDGAFTLRDLDTNSDIPIQYKAGQFFAVYCNSFKFPQAFVDKVVAAADLRRTDTITDRRQWMHIHALQAV